MTPVRPSSSTRKLATVVVALVVSLVLSSCVLFRQGEEFAIGTESNRANLVIYRPNTDALDRHIHLHGVASTRNLLIDISPTFLQFPTKVYVVTCAVSPALCTGAHLLAQKVLSWWKTDVRNRGDFHEAMHQGNAQDKCFAWTFIALRGRNFTVKPPGNSGCR